MKRIAFILALVLMASTLSAQTQERNITAIEVETGIDILDDRTSFNIEARYNFRSPWDVGVKARLDYISMAGDNVHPIFDVVGDYNLRRGKDLSFFAGAGIGARVYQDDDSRGNKSPAFHFMPRVGIEVVNHVRLTGYLNFFDMKYTGAGLNAGVVLGGSRVENKASNTYHFEFEPYVGIATYGEFLLGLEARYNFNSKWDVGVNANMDFSGSRLSAVGDYNFLRNGVANIFCGLGAGYAYTDILHCDEALDEFGDRCAAETDDLFYFYPRVGVELFDHLRFTLSGNIYNFEKAELVFTVGVAICGGKK